MVEIQECVNGIFKNKEWLFSGIGVTIISFFLGRKSVNWNITLINKSKKTIKGCGINNRTAEIYHEDYSTHIYKTEIKNRRQIVDYNTAISVGVGASGASYTAISTGIMCFKGLNGKAIINNLAEVALFPNGCILEVEKNDNITIEYDRNSFLKKEIIFFAKKDI